MSTRTFYASKDNGVVMVVNSGKSDNQLAAIAADPYNNLNDIYFHSGLDYVQMTGRVYAASVTFVSVARTTYSWSNSSSCLGLC